MTAMNSNVVQILNSTIVHNQGTNGGGVYLNICNHTAINGNVYGYNRALKAGGAHWQTQCNGGPFPGSPDVSPSAFKWYTRGVRGGRSLVCENSVRSWSERL